MSQRFFVGNTQYDIPDDVRDAFLKANPNAIPGIEYDVDGKKYSIPASIKDSFIQKYPNAVLGGQPKMKLPEPPKPREIGEVLEERPEAVTAQPISVAESAKMPVEVDPQAEAIAKGESPEPIFSTDPRDKTYRFRANLIRETFAGYPEMGLDEPQTPGETASDVVGAIFGSIASLSSLGAVSSKALIGTGKKLPRVVEWINRTLSGNTTAKKLAFNSARDLLSFNVHGQVYNRPDIKTLEDRLNLAMENSITALAFSGAGALSHIPKYGKKLGTTAMGILGWETGGDTFEDKVINSITLMGLHTLFNPVPNRKGFRGSTEDLLTEIYPNLSKKEAQRISKQLQFNILSAKEKIPKSLQEKPLLLLPEKAESIRLARPVGQPYDPRVMPFGEPMKLPPARTTTGFERGSAVRIKGIGKYAGETAVVREFRPDGKVKVFIETKMPTVRGARKFKGERIFTTDQLEPVQPITTRGEIKLTPQEQLSFELKEVQRSANPTGKAVEKASNATREYRKLDTSVKETQTILDNPNLTQQQRTAYENSLNQLKKLKQELRETGEIKLYSGFPIFDLLKTKRTMRDLSPKEIDLLYREALNRPLIDAQAVGKPRVAPEGVKDVQTKYGVFSNIVDGVKQVRNRVVQPESKVLFRKIEKADEEWHTLFGKYSERLNKVGFDEFTEAQGLQLSQALEAGKAPEVKAILDDIISQLRKNGVKIGYIENYFPRVWKREVAEKVFDDLATVQKMMINSGNKSDAIIATYLRDQSKETLDLVNHLIKTKQATSYSKAIQRLQKDVSNQLFPESSFEKARKLDLPATIFERDARKVIPYYLDTMTKRLSLAKQFGADGSKALRAIEKVGRKDTDESRLLHEVLDMYTGNAERVKGYTGKSRDLLNAYYGFEVGSKIGLGTATIPNLTQTLVSTMPQWGVFRTLRAGIDLLNPQSRQFARSTGIFKDSMVNALSGVEPTGVMGKFSKYATKLGFEQANKFNLYLAANTFKMGARDLMKVANSNSVRANWARKTLKQFGINYKSKLTDDLLAKKMYRFAVDSQLQKNVLKDPKIFNDPKWRPLFLFKRFGVRQATMIKDMLKTEIKNGNVMPILRLMAGGALGGEFVIWAKNEIKSLATGEEYYRKESEVMDRFLNNLAAVGSFGIISDFMEAEELSKLPDKALFAITPVGAQDVVDIADATESVLRDAEKYESFTLAVRRNLDDYMGLLGGLSRYIGKRFLTKQQETERQKRFRSLEKAEILDLILDKKKNAAIRRMRLWNQNNPTNPLTIEDVNHKQVFQRLKAKQSALIKASQ
tara:strand:- start:9 stop:3905 length:3897 start_codon:yes stop_codon:yes gene_type:complete